MAIQKVPEITERSPLDVKITALVAANSLLNSLTVARNAGIGTDITKSAFNEVAQIRDRIRSYLSIEDRGLTRTRW